MIETEARIVELSDVDDCVDMNSDQILRVDSGLYMCPLASA